MIVVGGPLKGRPHPRHTSMKLCSSITSRMGKVKCEGQWGGLGKISEKYGLNCPKVTQYCVKTAKYLKVGVFLFNQS